MPARSTSHYATLGGPWNSTRVAGQGPCPLPSRATCATAEDYLVTFTSALAAQRPVIPGAGTSAPHLLPTETIPGSPEGLTTKRRI